MNNRTRVYLTIETAGAEERVEGGRVVPPQGYDLLVWGRLRNRHDQLGITLFDHVLAAHGLRATFFVEPLGAQFFGIDGLREVCSYLRDRGHDVQLLLHPIQKNPGYLTKEDDAPSDDLGHYAVDAQASLVREGIATLAKCGVPASEVVALRAGGCAASETTWDAMRKAGLTLSSSYDRSRSPSPCRLRPSDPRIGVFPAGPDLWELPIGGFVEPDGRARALRLAELDADEMRDAIVAARAAGAREVVVVAQSSDFVRVGSVVRRTGRPRPLNLRRFDQLCRFLREHDRDFVADTCGALARRLARSEEPEGLVSPSGWPRVTPPRPLRRLAARAFAHLEAQARA